MAEFPISKPCFVLVGFGQRIDFGKDKKMLLPVKKILVPTDFSEPSYAGLKTAVELAKHFRAELLLVHIVSPIPMAAGALGPSADYFPRVLKEIEASAKNSIQLIAKTHIPDVVQAHAKVYIGIPATEIARVAAAENADIIVIAGHGQSGWKKFISGSVAERVARLSDRPVLTVNFPEPDAGQADG